MRLRGEHPSTLAVAHNLSIDLNLLGDPDEAAILHTKTSASFRKVDGRGSCCPLSMPEIVSWPTLDSSARSFWLHPFWRLNSRSVST